MTNFNMDMEYYLNESLKGNADAALSVVKMLVANGKSTDYFVQKHLHRAAELGNTCAQRILGILGICNRLITEDSTISNVQFNTDKSEGFIWLNESACSGDVVATYLVGKCYQYGFGVNKDKERAQRYSKQVFDKITFDVIIESILLFEFVIADSSANKTEMQDIFNDFEIDRITAIAS